MTEIQRSDVTDEGLYSVLQWSNAVAHLADDPEDEGRDHGQRTVALDYAISKMTGCIDDAAAVVRAAREAHGESISPAQVADMVDAYQTKYDDWAEVAQDWLDDHADGLRVEWIKEDAKDFWGGLKRESEIWVDLGPIGLYVFGRPGWGSR